MAEGLREERQLWGQELAQQGAELAQDRGRMEAQIESLTSETASLREDLQVHTSYSMHHSIYIGMCSDVASSGFSEGEG